MRILPTTNMNDAIKRMSDGNAKAASVLAMLLREVPQHFMDYVCVLDSKQIYGKKISDIFEGVDNNMEAFIEKVSGCGKV